MAETKVKKISTANTKKEMLEAYNQLVESLKEKKENEIKADEKIREKEVQKAIDTTDQLSNELINKKISELKLEFGTALTKLSEKIEEEFSKYQSVKKAVLAKEKELSEIFEIQKNAQSLYALIEAQKTKKEAFELEMSDKAEELEEEIEEKRKSWEKEKAQKEADIKEKDKQEQAIKAREKEEYQYKLQREKQIANDEFESNKAAMEKELADLRENTEKDLKIREQKILESETELKELRAKADAFPKELATAVEKAAKDATEKIIIENKHREELLNSTFEGEKKSLLIKIESLEKTIKEQTELIAKYSTQLEKSYTQIQDIATQAVSRSQSKQFASIPAIPAQDQH